MLRRNYLSVEPELAHPPAAAGEGGSGVLNAVRVVLLGRPLRVSGMEEKLVRSPGRFPARVKSSFGTPGA